MTTDKTKRASDAAQEIQRRFGTHTLRRLQTAPTAQEIPHIPTSYLLLDRALGIGGIPCGRITELIGRPTCGMDTLAFRIMASAQHQGNTAVYVDMDATFNPLYAGACGVNVEAMLLVRPPVLKDGFDIADILIRGKGVGVMV